MTIKELKSSRLLVIGLGLIGGSFAAACRKNGVFDQVAGYDRDTDSIFQAEAMGVIDQGFSDLEQAVSAADVIFLAVPILAHRSLLQLIQPFLKPDVVLTDGGSTKGIIETDIRAELTGDQIGNYVPGHPIAGAERSGVAASDPELYRNHRIILTPLNETRKEALEMVQAMWRGVGAETDIMDIAHHDDVLAATSHLPHLLAFNLVDTLAKHSENREIFHYAAGGFRDFTRIAASDPVMWHDIFMANRQSVLKQMDRYLNELHLLRNAVAHADGDYMKATFTHAKESRDYFSKILSDRESTKNKLD